MTSDSQAFFLEMVGWPNVPINTFHNLANVSMSVVTTATQRTSEAKSNTLHKQGIEAAAKCMTTRNLNPATCAEGKHSLQLKSSVTCECHNTVHLILNQVHKCRDDGTGCDTTFAGEGESGGPSWSSLRPVIASEDTELIFDDTGTSLPPNSCQGGGCKRAVQCWCC